MRAEQVLPAQNGRLKQGKKPKRNPVLVEEDFSELKVSLTLHSECQPS